MKRRQGMGAIFVFCILFTILLFLRADAASEGIRRGLSICAETLIPSLFPFMVISEMLVRSGLGGFASKYLGKPMQGLFGVSGACAGALMLGILCGFPVGAKTCAALYDKGEICKDDAEALLSFCNFPSPPFMIFAVGEGLFGDRRLGLLLYFSSLVSGLAYGIISSFGRRKRERIRLSGAPFEREPTSEIFTRSVSGAASALIAVCAYVVFFTCAVSCISGILAGGSEQVRAILFSFFELTSGASVCAELGGGMLSAVLCSAAAGWSGLCIFFQISSLARGLSMKGYLVSKAFSSLISAAITFAALKFLPNLIPRAPVAQDAFLPLRLYPDAFIRAVNIIFILSLLFYLAKLLDRRALI